MKDEHWFSISKEGFFQSYYTDNNSEEDFLIEPLITDFLIDQWFLPLKQSKIFAWHTRIIKWIINQPWMAFEYFIIDYLARHPRITDQYKLSHRKWPYILDHEIKADLTTHLASNTNRKIDVTFWTQVHFQNIKKSFGQISNSLLKKEIDIWQWVYENQHILDKIPHHISPEIPAFINISSVPFFEENGEGKFTIFSDAFKKWEELWYHSGWPTEHLPVWVKEFLTNMTYFYQKSCMSLINFINFQIIWRSSNLSYQNRTEHKNAIRVNTYNSDKRRMVYDFYNKSGSKKLIATITFHIPEQIITKIWQQIHRSV